MGDFDDYKEQVKQAFARDPLPLVTALGLRVDERASKGSALWVFDGNEQKASLQIGGKPGMEGLCSRYGDDFHQDCFELVRRYRPNMSFRDRRDFVAGIYGLRPPEKQRQAPHPEEKIIRRASYAVKRDGVLLGTHKRLDYEGGGKRMWWEWPNAENHEDLSSLPLWRSEALAEHPTRAVWVCEGEKDADALAAHGVLALGTYGADVVPSEAVLQGIVGRKVYLWPDADGAGHKHMEAIARRLAQIGWQCRVVQWEGAPHGAGATDWFSSGLTLDDLKALAQTAPVWIAAEDPPDEGGNTDAASLLAQAGEAVNGIRTYSPPNLQVGFRAAAEFAEAVILETEERRNLPAGIYGLRSGWPSVDRHVSGFKWQQLILLMGGSGIGKTTLLFHYLFATVEHLLETRSDSVMLVRQLEGGIDQFQHAWAGYHYGVPLWAFAPGGQDRTDDAMQEKIMRAYGDFPALPIEFSENTDGDRMMVELEQRVLAGPVEAILLDNVQDLTFQGNKWAGICRVAGWAKDFCRTTGVPFVALSQVNDHKGQAESPRGGPEWFNAASCVLYVKRGEPGATREVALKTNISRLMNLKLRHSTHGILPEARLKMDLATKRLWEEQEYDRRFTQASMQEHEEAMPWHSQ